jgi:pectinesterase
MTGHRRLLEVDRDGYPSWLPDGDRALISQLQKGGIIQPNATVAKDGSGEYKSVAEGINSYPKNYHGRYIIYVKAGIYQKYVVGDGPTRTIITGSKNQHEGIAMPETAIFGMLTINLSLLFPYFP